MFSPTDLPKNVVDNGAIQSSVLVNGGSGAVVEGTGEASGTGGDIFLNARSVGIQNGATVSANNSGSGQGGTVLITASEGVTMSGTNSGVLTNATGQGPGGSIEVQAERIAVIHGATISAASSGPGNAGSITLTADTILLDEGRITTEADEASGGNIKLQAEELIQLNDSTIESSVQGDEDTAGGDISLDPDFIILQNSQILANAVSGQGGNITLIADKAVVVDSLSILDASSSLGISGTVNIQAPTQFLNSAVETLPHTPVNVARLYAARCVAGKGGHFSTFVDSKTDSLAPTPGTFLSSPILPSLDSSAREASDYAGNLSRASQVNASAPIQLATYIPPGLLTNGDGDSSACP